MAKKPAPKPEPSTELALFGVTVDVEDGPDSVVAVSTIDQPLLVLTQPEAREKLYADIIAEVSAHVPDMSTETSRKRTASLAYKVARTKTAIDKAGLKATEDARAMISSVNRERNIVSAQLEILQQRAREPLTKWEAAEAERLEKVNAKILEVRTAGIINFDDTSEEIAQRVTVLKAMQAEIANPVAEQFWGEHLPVITGALQGSLTALDAAFTRIKREEDDRAELERLRTADRERQERDREAELAKQQEENENDLARGILDHIAQIKSGWIAGEPYPFGILLYELEDKIKPEDFAERHRPAIEKAKSDAHAHLTAEMQRQLDESTRRAADNAAEQARQEEAQRAADEQAERDRQHEAELEAQRQETARLQREKDEREAAERQAEEERRQREADQAHRTKIRSEAKQALMTIPRVDEETARAIVILIQSGEVPHVKIEF